MAAPRGAVFYSGGNPATTNMRKLIRQVLRPIFAYLFSIQRVGEIQSAADRRLLIIANHGSFLDGFLLWLYLPVNPVFVVHTWVARAWYFRPLLAWIDYIVIEPSSPMALKQVIRLLESGRQVVIFPEGRISVTGCLMKVYDGPAFVAAKTGAAVMPVCLDGSSNSCFSRVSGKSPRRWFPGIRITFLPPRTLAMPEASTAKARRRKAGDAMRRMMQEMLYVSRPPQTLFSALCDAMEIHGRGHRLIEDLKQTEYSYQDLLKMSLMLTRLIERAAPELGDGDRIGLLLPNLAPTLGLIFGLTARSRVPAMLNYTAGVDGMQTACTAATLKLVVSSRAFVEQAKLAEKLAKLRDIRIIYLEDLRATMTWKDKVWLMSHAIWLPRRFERPGNPDNPAVVLFTSGSESKPKGVVLSHRALMANIAQIRAVIDFSANDKILNALPVFHSFGLTAGALLPILNGVGLFLYPSPLHYRVIPEIAYDRNCTILFGTSTFLANYGKFAHPYDFFRMRYVVAGAEKLADQVRELWHDKFGLRILEGYGATETAPVLAVNTPMAYRSGSVGQLLPGIQHRVRPVPGIDSGGLLHVRGANLMAGYLKHDRPGELQPPQSELGVGWYETGDIVALDADGFLSIIGRVKRFAKIAGEMISLEAVEKLALEASPNHLHAASSQPDATKGEILVLFTTDRGLTRDTLMRTARESGQGELTVARKIVYLETLPLLGTGKTDYVTLKDLAAAA